MESGETGYGEIDQEGETGYGEIEEREKEIRKYDTGRGKARIKTGNGLGGK